MTEQTAKRPADRPWGSWWDGASYALDAWQRSILFLDLLRERGDQYREHVAETAPNVLNFGHELVVDGRTLPRPVNYGLVRIVPPAELEARPQARPVVVIDPRAGHGPGIGGFKADSEIGMALRAGHPCYFVGFLPEPVEGQTIEDVLAAEAHFLETVLERHPQAVAKPFVIGNCQAGWALLMLASLRPELVGPLLVAGAPVSYWAGERGGSAMRYAGGLLGGTWLTALASDLGNGRFDGAHLVANFEGMNPANTLWTKQYDVWAEADTAGPRYLGFERWWGGHVELEAAEIQFITDRLFVGNQLATAEIVTSDGKRIDLRNITGPIVVFCSKGDDITPPAQALGWILDLYESETDLLAHGQTVVYTVHDRTGHLGIFVSGSVARKEHGEFAENVDLIDVLPPGLYEAVLRPRTPEAPGAEFATGDWIVRFERRRFDDIRPLVGEPGADERAFAAMARISEINLGLYRTFAQPWVRALTTAQSAERLRQLHPLRLGYELFSDANPFMRGVKDLAQQVRAERKPAAPDNPFLAWQAMLSEQVEAGLRSWGELRDRAGEALFFATYGSPFLQALVGLKAEDRPLRQRPASDPAHVAFVQRRTAELRAGLAQGGVREAFIRAMLHVAGEGGAFDERLIALLRKIREERGGDMTLGQFKQVLREQSLMLVLDEPAALEGVRSILERDPGGAAEALAVMDRITRELGMPEGARRQRYEAVRKLFEEAARPSGEREAAGPSDKAEPGAAARQRRQAAS